MATDYPGSLDSFTNPTATDTFATANGSTAVPHASQHANLNDAVLAIQTKLGTTTTKATFPAGITISTAPLAATDAATKGYVDAAITGLNIHESCEVATTAAFASVSYADGVTLDFTGGYGPGATLTNTGTLAEFTLDGYTPAQYDRILVKNQADARQNGIYSLTAVGSGSVAWVLTRTSDYDNGSALEVNAGDLVFVIHGTTNIASSWVQTNEGSYTGAPQGGIIIKSSTGDNLTFSQVTGAGSSATNLAGTTQYSIPYQTSSGVTGYLSIGSANQLLAVNSTTNGYTWTSPSSLTIGTATNAANVANATTTSGSTFYINFGATNTTTNQGTNTNASLTYIPSTGTLSATVISGTSLGGSLLSSATPLVNGTATAGISLIPSRDNHVHPTDTTRAPLASPTFTGAVTVPATGIIYPGSTSGNITLQSTAIAGSNTITLPASTGTIALTSGVINNILTTTTGDMIYASGANTPARLGIGATNQVLTVIGGVPSWQNSAPGFTNPMTTAGDIIYGGTSGVATRLAGSATNGWILTYNTVTNAPTWAAPSASGVSSFSAGTTGLTPSTGTTGAITLAGTLLVANGGTGVATAGITAFNNITGYTAAGATGTTSTNLVFSTSPTLTTPKIDSIVTNTGAATAATLFGDVTTGSITVGNTLTGNITLAGATGFTGTFGIANSSTSAHTVGISNGAGTTNKTISIGTSSTGGTTAITLGSSSGATSTITLNGAITTSSTINKVTITAPTTSAILTLITGSTLATSTAASLTLGLSSAATTVATIPSGTVTLVDLASTQALTGKTISGLTVSTTTGTLTIPAATIAFSGANNLTITTTAVTAATLPSGTITLQDLSTAQTITGVKTFSTAPVISTITNTGTITLPTSTDTLVGRATADTLTNKTLTSPAINTPSFTAPKEVWYSPGVSSFSGASNYDVKTFGGLYYGISGYSSSNFSLNFRGDGTTTLNSLMAVGEALTVSVINLNNTTGYYCTGVTVDTNATISVIWSGGTAPSAGNVSSKDVYQFTIFKQATSNFIVLASGPIKYA